MNDNPFKTPPEWDERTGWRKLRDGWRRGWRAYDNGLKQLEVSHLSGCGIVLCGAFIAALLLFMLCLLAYAAFVQG